MFIVSFSRKLKLSLCIMRMEKKVLNTITHFGLYSNGDTYNTIFMNDRMYVILQTSSYAHLGIKERCISDKTMSIANLSMNWSSRLHLSNGLINMEELFKEIKSRISDGTILAVPSTDHPFHIRVDSSNVGTGSILVRQFSEAKRIVSFISRVFDNAEQMSRRGLYARSGGIWSYSSW